MLTPEQIANRRKGIGASETAIVMGISSLMTPYQLWRIKTGLDDSPDLSDQPQVHWGSILEELIAQEYARLNGIKVRRVNETLIHKTYPFLLCHLDRKITGKDKCLECKYAMFNRDEWGEAGSDVVPVSYILQVQHQLAVTGYDEADLAVLIGGYDFRIYHFKRDPEIINRIIQECSAFWKYVENKIAPTLIDRKDVELKYPYTVGKLKEANKDIFIIYSELLEQKENLKKIEPVKKELEKKLALFIQEHDGLVYNDVLLATYKHDKRGIRSLRIKD